MELNKQHWSNLDIKLFEKYLENKSNPSKINWTKRIINTNKNVLAIPTPTLRKITKEILKGNYLQFLNLQIFSSHESIIIYGIILSKIRDFDTLKYFLTNYIQVADNWAVCDILSFNISNNESKFFNLSQELLCSKQTFARRIGIIILFKFISVDINKIFSSIESMSNEKEYYVNMAISWLLCECFIQCRNATLNFLQTSNISIFVLNKTIQKCRDSYRISKEDKQLLSTLKK